MTGYEEILTDPSYAGQIVTFTFPHIGNVGTNGEDIETVNARRLRRARLCAEGRHHRTGELARRPAFLRLAQGPQHRRHRRTRYPRPHRSHREKGMPNGIVAHYPDGTFDVDGAEAGGGRTPLHGRPGPRAGNHRPPEL